MQGLMLRKSNSQMDTEEAEALRLEREAEDQSEERVFSSLSAHIERFWEVARRHKEPIEKQMLRNLRQISGRYTDEKAREIQSQGLPLIFMHITSVKCRAAKSWIRDVLMPAGDKPWMLKATKIPSLPQEMKVNIATNIQQQAMQAIQYAGAQITPDQLRSAYELMEEKFKEKFTEEAEKRIAAMEDLIEDQLSESNWDKQFNDALSDVVDFPAGILKGPVLRKTKELKWSDQEGLVAVNKIKAECERVDPFSFYPAPGITEPDEGDCIEIHDYQLSDIHDLIGLPGYDEEKIRLVLKDYRSANINSWSRETLRSEKYNARGHTSSSHNDEKTIEGMEYWGSVQGRLLLEWGKSEQEIQDPDEMYDIMALKIGSHVVCVRINPDPLGKKPYSKACFENIPGSFWGYGVPDLISDCQDVCNASARSLVANMGISSGPQVAVNTGSLLPGEEIEQMYPWKIWQLDFSKGAQTGSRPPIEFFQPDGNTDALMKVFKEFSSLADEYSGIPAYSYGVGNSVGGAGKTASGLSMLMNAASKSIKNVIKHIDSGMIASLIHRFYIYNMLFEDDNSIKGDAQVIARGALSLVAREQNQMRLQEILAQTGNELDMQIIGIEGRAEILRKAFQGVDVAGDVVPSKEELMQKLEKQRVQQQQAAMLQQGMQP